MSIEITPLQDELLDAWLAANETSRGTFHTERLLRFWQEMLDGKRAIYTAWHEGVFLGHIMLQHASEYPPFRKQHIPEIVDVWVQPSARRQGIAQHLMDIVIGQARMQHAPAIGMGVGVTAEYGAAHLLYSKNGFTPDGTGLWFMGAQAHEHEKIVLGPETILMWIKKL